MTRRHPIVLGKDDILSCRQMLDSEMRLQCSASDCPLLLQCSILLHCHCRLLANHSVPTYEYSFEYRGQYSIVNLQGEQVSKSTHSHPALQANTILTTRLSVVRFFFVYHAQGTPLDSEAVWNRDFCSIQINLRIGSLKWKPHLY